MLLYRQMGKTKHINSNKGEFSMKKITLIVSVLVFMFVSVNGALAANLIEHFEKYGLKCTKETLEPIEKINTLNALFGAALEFNNTESVIILAFALKNPGWFCKDLEKYGGILVDEGKSTEFLKKVNIIKTSKNIIVLIVYGDHPLKNRIEKAFISFGKKNKSKDIFVYFYNNGLRCTKVIEKIPEIIGAIAGAGYEFNNTDSVEIYKYDWTCPVSQKIFKEVKRNGSFKIAFGINSFQVPAKINRDLLLMVPDDDHPLKNRIVKAFMSFKKK